MDRALSDYPGMPSAEMAQPIAVAPGDEKFRRRFLRRDTAERARRNRGANRPDTGRNHSIDLGQPPKPPAGTGTIRGRVTRGDGFPVARANVTALTVPTPGGAPNIGLGLNAVTDEDGRYEFAEVMRGRYRIRASKPGFIDSTYGQPSAETGTPVDVAENQLRTQIDILLPRHSAIAGQVVDDFGDPVEGVAINVWVIQFQGGRRRLMSRGVGTRVTDDLGRYRIYGVQPGQYVISATVGQVNQQVAGAEVSGFAPTYFPGTTSPAEVQLVTVPRSQDVAGVDVALVPLPTASITGRKIGADGQPMGGSLC